MAFLSIYQRFCVYTRKMMASSLQMNDKKCFLAAKYKYLLFVIFGQIKRKSKLCGNLMPSPYSKCCKRDERFSTLQRKHSMSAFWIWHRKYKSIWMIFTFGCGIWMWYHTHTHTHIRPRWSAYSRYESLKDL